MSVKVKEIKCKSCLNKSKLSDYVINPYLGCYHGCKYCYAVFIKRFQNIKDGWGEFCYVKINCPDLLDKELEKNKPGNIWFSSVTDCYNPLEGKYKVTRKILEKMIRFKDKYTVEILTKSALVRRDFDLIKKLRAEIGVSLNTLDPKISRIIEPFASSPLARIKALKEADKLGIKTYGFISPVLPGITNLEEIFKEISFCNYVWIELLNTKQSVLNRLMPIIEKNFPNKLGGFRKYIENPNKFYREIKKQAEKLEKQYNLKIKDIIIH